MLVTFYTAPDGTKPVAEYMRALAKGERARLAEVLYRIEQNGLDDSGVVVKPIAGKLWEIKVSAQRAFYVLVSRDELVVLHAYYKKSQKAPVAEIAIAETRMHEVLGG